MSTFKPLSPSFSLLLTLILFLHQFLFNISGVSVLFSQNEKKESLNHIENVEATMQLLEQQQQTAAEVVRNTQSLRTIEMRLAMNNDIMGDEDLLNYPNLTSILGRDLSLYHRYFHNIIIQ